MGVPQGTPINTTSLPLSPSYPLRAIVTAHIPHLALHHLAKEVGGVNEILPARVYAHVGYGPAPSCFLEEDQVAGRRSPLGTYFFSMFHCLTGCSGSFLPNFLKTSLVRQEQSSDR